MTKTERREYIAEINSAAYDILGSENMQLSKGFIQHGSVSVYEHSVSVTVMCLRLADLFHINADRRAMIRGALLHDYFLYDWHEGGLRYPPHGFTHAETAMRNACRDFSVGRKERDMIYCHMFPLNITRVPGCRESAILCVADKLVSTEETVNGFAERLAKSAK